MIEFLRLESTKKYITALSEVLKVGESHLIQTKSGKGGGTWVHKLLAYELAKWLNPKLAVFINMVFDSELRQQIETAKQAKRKAEIREGYAWNALDRKDLYI